MSAICDKLDGGADAVDVSCVYVCVCVCGIYSSQLGGERARCSQLSQELDALRARVVDAESRVLTTFVETNGFMARLPRWLQQLIADRTTSLYIGVIGVVTVALLWLWVSTR